MKTIVCGMKNVIQFYRDGFRRMTVGKTLWKIIIIKLIVMFAVFKLFFFPNYLNTNFDTDSQRADHVLDRLTLQPAEDVGNLKNMNKEEE